MASTLTYASMYEGIFDTEMTYKDRTRSMHTTVFGATFSPCGKYLVACNNFGTIVVFSISSALNPDATLKKSCFQVDTGPIYSLISTDKFLISGGSSGIHGWRWSEILEPEKLPSPAWTLNPPASNILDAPETNALAFNEKDNILFSGCGDNNIYLWDLECGTCKDTIKGHTDYVQCLTLRPRNGQCISGSEDGTVRLWDCRSPGGMIHKIEPHKNKLLSRPKFGSWIGCVAVDPADDWMVCGGGPSLSVWHLRSLSCTSVLDTPASSQQTVMFHDDGIISAGTEPSIFHWQMNGELKSQVPCTAQAVFALQVNDKSKSEKILVSGGSSAHIDAFINFGYKAFSFRFS